MHLALSPMIYPNVGRESGSAAHLPNNGTPGCSHPKESGFSRYLSGKAPNRSDASLSVSSCRTLKWCFDCICVQAAAITATSERHQIDEINPQIAEAFERRAPGKLGHPTLTSRVRLNLPTAPTWPGEMRITANLPTATFIMAGAKRVGFVADSSLM
jgi:hypothetical protein